MGFLNSLGIRGKLLLLVSPPLVVMLAFGLISFKSSWGNAKSTEQVLTLIELTQLNSALAHEMQKERGMSAGYLGSGGTKFIAELPAQRGRTDELLTRWTAYQAQTSFAQYPDIASETQAAAAALARLQQLRKSVTDQSAPLGDVLKYYTGTIALLLAVPAEASAYANDPSTVKKLLAYHAFLQGKERAGIERAVLSNVFARDAFTPELFARFMQLMSEQNAFLGSFREYADGERKALYQGFVDSQENKAVLQMREVALARSATGEFGIAAEDWFKAATARINALKTLEDAISASLGDLTQQVSDQAHAKAFATMVILIAMLVGAPFVTLTIIRSMLRQVRQLVAGIRRASHDLDLHQGVTVYSTDELGMAANDFNKMQARLRDIVALIDETANRLRISSSNSDEAIRACSTNMERQQTEASRAVSRVRDMESSSHSMSSDIATVATQAEKAAGVTQHSAGIVKDNLQCISSLNDSMSSVAEVIRQLNDSSESIGSVLGVIKSIAEQTNLLALNAAIEAARAGEQGRGFAVVADEVRTLAQKTQSSTSEIESIISQFQKDSRKAYDTVEGSKASVTEAVALADSLNNELAMILEAVQDIRDRTDQVTSIASEQVKTNQRVTESMTEIHNLAECTATTGARIMVSAKEQGEMAVKLSEQSSRFVL